MEFFPAQRREPASSRPPTAASAIKEGAQAYREMRWDDATGILNRALRSGTCTNPEQNQAHILLGAIEYQQGNPQAAKAHFVAACRYDRDTSPSSQLFPPQLIDFYRTVNGLKRP
jgi:tetratricopeptide (TPR) repeat protein